MVTVQPVLPAIEMNKVDNTTSIEPSRDFFVPRAIELADGVDIFRDTEHNDEYDVIKSSQNAVACR